MWNIKHGVQGVQTITHLFVLYFLFTIYFFHFNLDTPCTSKHFLTSKISLYFVYAHSLLTGISSVATGWTVPWSNPGGGGEDFPNRSWGPPSLLYNRYRFLPGCKTTGAWRWPPTPSSAEVKERVQLHIYSPFGPSWPVLGWPLPLPLHKYTKITIQHFQCRDEFSLLSWPQWIQLRN